MVGAFAVETLLSIRPLDPHRMGLVLPQLVIGPTLPLETHCSFI